MGGLDEAGQEIVGEEIEILERVHVRLEHEASAATDKIEDLDAQLIELRDAIAEAKEEDVPSLIDQMHQVAALSRKRGKGRSIPIDPKNPYFGHLRIRESKSSNVRDVLIGKHTLLDNGDGVTIVDWRNAPVSRLYYRYEEEDDYEEEFDDRSIQGRVLVRRSLAVSSGSLRRVAAPQGTYAMGPAGWREAVGSAKPTLEGGAGAAVRVPKGQLGVHSDDSLLRADKHLQEITALIDKQQFDLITHPESGIVLIQGGAGSGKTTVALHRVAYLAFHDGRRFAPNKMLVVVFNEGLVEYIRHVLPSLGVEGVGVTTYRRWSAQLVSRLKLKITRNYTDSTPDSVVRFKKHPIILKMLDAILAEQLEEVEAHLRERLDRGAPLDSIVTAWKNFATLPPVARAERLIKWVGSQRGALGNKAKAAAETVFRSARDTLRDVVSDWLELNTAGPKIRQMLAEHAPGDFSDADIDTIVRWCAKKADIDMDSRGADGEGPEMALDREDDAILLRLLQIKFGGIFVGGKRFEYEHVVIDEAQDLCPLEVRVLLDSVTKGRSVTIAGDRAQKMIFDNGFSDWPQLLADAGLPHVEIQPLKITYRSTRQVMEFSRDVLGPLHNPEDQLIAREGAPVGYFEFPDMGESVAFLGEALRNLMRREPSASVALITRYPQQADTYYRALRVAEVPRLRRVRREDFTFTAGIDVTDVRQVKGLEFDYVVVLDPSTQNFPQDTQARHLLHIAATRAAYQLWLVGAGRPSKLLPLDLTLIDT